MQSKISILTILLFIVTDADAVALLDFVVGRDSSAGPADTVSRNSGTPGPPHSRTCTDPEREGENVSYMQTLPLPEQLQQVRGPTCNTNR